MRLPHRRCVPWVYFAPATPLPFAQNFGPRLLMNADELGVRWMKSPVRRRIQYPALCYSLAMANGDAQVRPDLDCRRRTLRSGPCLDPLLNLSLQPRNSRGLDRQYVCWKFAIRFPGQKSGLGRSNSQSAPCARSSDWLSRSPLLREAIVRPHVFNGHVGLRCECQHVTNVAGFQRDFRMEKTAVTMAPHFFHEANFLCFRTPSNLIVKIVVVS